MNSKEIENNLINLLENFSKEEFIYDLLLAYGISKTSVTRLKKGDFNLSKIDGEVLYKKKIFFKVEATGNLLNTIDEVSKTDRILKQKPRFAIVTDYKKLVAKDLKLGRTLDIELNDLINHYSFFLPLAGSEVYKSSNENEADRNAAYKMATLYDKLRERNPNIYTSTAKVHDLNIFLSRLLFCFFAEDTEIFEEDSIFTNTLVQHTAKNGSDTHIFLDELFDRLNTKTGNFSAHLANFPYVNGGLFQDKINSPLFSGEARKILIQLGDLDWKDINPDIFGSMIQAVVIDEYRSDLGMHYTSVPNILKLIKPLFLDELYEVFEKQEDNITGLRKLINRIANIKFFDPACGSGNFLIITYKEIRVLEIKILRRIIDLSPTPAMEFTQIRLSQFYGIEIDDFAHEMAILALWLAEHQMNQIFEEQLLEFGQSKPILPLKQAGNITQGNATRIDWKAVCPIAEEDEVYIIGNPPYYGSRKQNKEQKDDLKLVFKNNYKSLDYISAWFYKGAKYIEGFNAKCAFVSTNSVCQGEQVALTWSRVMSDNLEFDFAHQSFKWTNNAKGNAGVTVIIVGLRNASEKPKHIYQNKLRNKVRNINPYLLDAPNIIIRGKTKPISGFPEMKYGNMPNDGGNLIIQTSIELNQLLLNQNVKKSWIKKFIGASEFIRGNERHCIWISDEEVENAKLINEIDKRLIRVVKHRQKSTEKSTREKSKFPNQFYFSSHRNTDSILIPRHSSENRNYIPMGFFNEDTVIADSAMAIYNAKPWLFAVITSRMHMTWVKAVGGKLETRYRYSAKLCYNTFPFPNINIKQKETLNQYVFDILDERAKHPSRTMAYLYNPDTMPKGLKAAHQALDTAIERCYRLQPFQSDTERLAYLFKLYEEMIKKDTLFAKQKKTRKKRKK